MNKTNENDAETPTNKLRQICLKITRQNHRLMAEMTRKDFDGFTRLDPTLNQGVTLIHHFNEAIIAFPPGCAPIDLAYPMVYSTLHLLRACEKRYGRKNVKRMAQAFREQIRLWFHQDVTRFPPDIFIKRIFIGENKLIAAICEHNAQITEPAPPPPPPPPAPTSEDVHEIISCIHEVTQAVKSSSKEIVAATHKTKKRGKHSSFPIALQEAAYTIWEDERKNAEVLDMGGGTSTYNNAFLHGKARFLAAKIESVNMLKEILKTRRDRISRSNIKQLNRN